MMIMKVYKKPIMELVNIEMELLSMSDVGPGAGDIDSPSIKSKSIWNEDNIDSYDI